MTLNLKINRRWSIQAGLRAGTGDMTQKSEFQVAYSRANEYERPDGSRANDLVLRKANPYQEQDRTVTVSIPRDRPVNDNAVLNVLVEEQQQVWLRQIPIGLQYEHAWGRFGWLWQAGIIANHMRFGDLRTRTAIVFGNRELPTDRARIPGQRFPAKRFASMYVGAGMRYQIYGPWSLAAQARYSPHLQSALATETKSYRAIDNTLSMSIFYQF